MSKEPIDKEISESPGKTNVIIALLSLYFAWGGTYLAMRIALESFPPFLMAGIRHLVAGAMMFIFLMARGSVSPGRSEMKGAAVIGILLLAGGNGGVNFAEQWVASGLAALGVATVPLWTVIFAGIWKKWPTRLELAGILVGFMGVVLLNLEGDMRAYPIGAIAILIAAISWAFGSAWSRHLLMPSGMMAAAVQMIAGGSVLLTLSLFTGESMSGLPSLRAYMALAYLVVFGSLVGFSAYVYLLKKVSPAVATSYAYVNPVMAVLLGVWFAGERITEMGVLAMVVITASVALVIIGQQFEMNKG